MRHSRTILLSATAMAGLAIVAPANAQTTPAVTQSDPARADGAQDEAPQIGEIGEIVVTAQKREQGIQRVGMSIQAATGETLSKLGIKDTSDLQKIVPGFLSNPTNYGTNIFTIRGVGYQDTSLAGGPTVTVYLDEAPLPYSALTAGTGLDLQRVEVLKGPQGTLFGQNATGGAVNYIANKPTDTLQAGGEFSFGRFNDIRATGYLSGPLTQDLEGRAAVEVHNSGAWQRGYGPQKGQSIGGADFLNGRVSLRWHPGSAFKALLTLNGWRDRGYNQVPQLAGIFPLANPANLSPTVANYPIAPQNNRAAGWNQCVNTSPDNPIAGQEFGATYLLPDGRRISSGPGSVVQAGGQPTSCIPIRRDNNYYSASLRMDYDLSPDIVLTSLTEYQHFDRRSALDNGGLPVQTYQTVQGGKISSFYQELRFAGNFAGKGTWLAGGNYGHDNTKDSFFATYSGSSLDLQAFPNGHLVPLGPVLSRNDQQKHTYAAFGYVEYPVLPTVTVLGGIRYTHEELRDQQCLFDPGSGQLSRFAQEVSNLQEFAAGTITAAQYLAGQGQGIDAGPGGCTSYGPGPLFQSLVTAPNQKLVQHNVSWRAGVNWQVDPKMLVYGVVSKGYKSGSYSTLPSFSAAQFAPVTQESLLAYEAGIKTSRLLNGQVTLNLAGFYYDYHDKQISGAIIDPIFGPLNALINIPRSHVVGFEASGIITPNALRGFTITPSVSYQKSRIDHCNSAATPGCVNGKFNNYSAFGLPINLTGQRFPQAPVWQANVDAEYEWSVGERLTAFVGANVNYSSSTTSYFIDPNPPASGYDQLGVPERTLLDLRAGVRSGEWRFQVWGRNVTNKYYWTAQYHLTDTVSRYTGMPATYGATLSFDFK